ncbi:MAG TPA: 2-phospho-L-lactate transferase [Blastocatellia bacterium]|nr:2-phospho-L-lactate transferase [Blastocatellia bacterium]
MKITALAGGIGASKFLLGLQSAIPPTDLTVIANTGDDIDLLGLRICPDIDTITYTLAGAVNPATGWGVEGDTFEALSWLARYGAPTWFNLGDRDLATHLFRTSHLKSGKTLTEVTDLIRSSLGVRTAIIPMTDSYTPTLIDTDQGEMHLQEYFVRLRCEPRVRGIRFRDIETSNVAPGVERALLDADVVIICPSNPFISIGPILSVPTVAGTLEHTGAEVVAITPIIRGKALKGPTAEMLRDLGHEVSATGVARLYRKIAGTFVLDSADAHLKGDIEELGYRVLVTDTLMVTLEDKQRLAKDVVAQLANR